MAVTTNLSFQSTPSLRKATFSLRARHGVLSHFNPHLPCGRRQRTLDSYQKADEFQSTPSLRKATFSESRFLFIGAFQSTPSLRKATLSSGESRQNFCISIHTFLAEGDCTYFHIPVRDTISIHTFLAEGDNLIGYLTTTTTYFNPHLPCGRRHENAFKQMEEEDFNPHLPCGRRHLV